MSAKIRLENSKSISFWPPRSPFVGEGRVEEAVSPSAEMEGRGRGGEKKTSLRKPKRREGRKATASASDASGRNFSGSG